MLGEDGYCSTSITVLRRSKLIFLKPFMDKPLLGETLIILSVLLNVSVALSSCETIKLGEIELELVNMHMMQGSPTRRIKKFDRVWIHWSQCLACAVVLKTDSFSLSAVSVFHVYGWGNNLHATIFDVGNIGKTQAISHGAFCITNHIFKPY